MAIKHLLEIDTATGAIVGEWRNDTARGEPTAIDGRAFMDVTNLNRSVGDLSSRGYRVVDGVLVEPPPRAPVIDAVSLFLLFTPAQRALIRAHRKQQVDDELEDFYEL